MSRSYDFLPACQRWHLLTSALCGNHNLSSFCEIWGWMVLLHYSGVLDWDKSLKCMEPLFVFSWWTAFLLYISCVLNSSCSLGKCRYSRQGFKGIINATKSGTADCHIGIFLVIHKHCVCAHWKTSLKYVLEVLKQRNWDSWCMWDECWINVGEAPSSSVVSQTSNTNLLP